MLDYLKIYLGIHYAVTIYDQKINDLIEIAMQDLTIAGVSGHQRQKIIFKEYHMQVNSISDVVIAGIVSANTNGINVASYQGDTTQYFSSFKKEEK